MLLQLKVLFIEFGIRFLFDSDLYKFRFMDDGRSECAEI